MRVVICVSYAFCSTDQERRESAHSVLLSLHVDISITIPFSLHVQGEKKPTFHDATTAWFSREMTPEEQAEKFHSDDTSCELCS